MKEQRQVHISFYLDVEYESEGSSEARTLRATKYPVSVTGVGDGWLANTFERKVAIFCENALKDMSPSQIRTAGKRILDKEKEALEAQRKEINKKLSKLK